MRARRGLARSRTSFISACLLVLMVGCREDTPLSLVVAAHGGDVAAVEAAIARGADVNALERHVTPLFAAVVANRTEVVSVLLNHGARLSVPLVDGPAPTLTHYLAGGRGVLSPPPATMTAKVPVYFSISATPDSPERLAALDQLGRLLRDAPDVREALAVVDGELGTPLHAAAQRGDAGAVKLLLGAGADPSLRHPEDPILGKTPLLQALARGDWEVSGALVAASPVLSLEDCQRWPVVAWLYQSGASLGHSEVIASLASRRGAGPVDGACRASWMRGFGDESRGARNLSAVLANGFDLATRFAGADALGLAIWTRDEATLAVVLAHAPTYTAQAFVLAAEDGWGAIVARAFSGEDRPSERDCKEALVLSAAKGQAEIVTILADATCPKATTAWDAALSKAQLDVTVLSTIVHAGARVDALGEDGDTALHRAARAGATDVASWLLAQGADPARPSEGPNTAGLTPIDCADRAGHRVLAETLRAHASLARQ